MYEILVKSLQKSFGTKRELSVFLAYMFVSMFAVFISLAISTSYNGSAPSLFAIMLALIPLVQMTSFMIEKEERILERSYHSSFLKRHEYFILGYFGILVGIVIAYLVSYFIFPQKLFLEQIKAISEIKTEVLQATANAINKDAFFGYIFINNLKVLMLAFFLALIYGAGAIYVISWNASIVGVFIAQKLSQGRTFQEKISLLAKSSLGILPHGIPEFLAYFMASLSGSLIALVLLLPKEKNNDKLLIDAVLLLVFSIVTLFIAAIIEAYL